MAGTTKGSKKASNSRTSSGKKTSGAKSNRGKQAKNQEPEIGFIRSEVFVIVAFALAVLLFLSNFRLCGIVGEFLRSVQLGLFGMAGYVAPIILFVGTCFAMANRENPIAALKLTAVIVGFFVVCGLLELLFGGSGGSLKLSEVYLAASKTGKGGGWFGGLLALGIGSVLGIVGSYFVLSVILVICVVCITEKSVVSAVKRGGGKAYQYAKEDADRRKVLHEERREERRRLREEQRVRGVNLDSTRLQEPEPYEEYEAEDVAWTGDDGQDIAVAEDVSQADVFTGNIQMPAPYIDEEDDTVPFDMADGIRHEDNSAEKAVPLPAPDREIPVAGSIIPGEPAFYDDPVSEAGSAFIQEETQFPAGLGGSVRETEDGGVFRIPEEHRRVVTASGKIIETDTEALQKKLEKKREEAKESDDLSVEQQIKQKPVIKKEYKFPPLSLLTRGSRIAGSYTEKEYKETAIKLQQTLRNFGVGVTVTNVSCGPSVTRYELHPEQGVKVSKIVGLADDIKLNLAAADIRIEAPIPGKAAVGIEVPNKENNTVYFRDLLESDVFKNSASRLTFAVGKDIGGQTVVADIAKMPHLLIAGATGSGKSVCINTLIMSIIYKANPDDVKMIMVDPKVVELSVYNGIPHLLIPVVTDPKKASGALNWAVAEMENRYKKFAEYNVRDLKGYNAKVENIQDIEDENKPQKMPQIIIIIDELADLMMVAPGEVEDAICRLAQLARAAGIHLVIATQRPSVNVITGLIKANVPSRIAFSVSSGVDSRTIIDMNGAEKLLGKGDMMFYPAGYQKPQRVQGAFVSDQEVSKVVEFLTQQDMTVEYSAEIENQISMPMVSGGGDSRSDRDEYFAQAGRFVIEKDKGSIGMLQRMFKIGFNRAARIMDQLAEAGVVGEEEGTKPRKILMTMEEFEAMLEQKAL